MLAQKKIPDGQMEEMSQGQNQRTTGKRNPKMNFVEARTFCHLYRSFDRLWIFYILAFQAMLIVAWSGSLSNLFNEDVSKNVLSIFITSAFLNSLQATRNIGVVIAIWAPIVLVYFMDTQIWYAIFSTIVGGIYGAFSHLGEIWTLGMLRSRFDSIHLAFSDCLVPSTEGKSKRHRMAGSSERKNIAQFSQMWNEFIFSIRMEDLISDRLRMLTS
ncbi:putative callose synthase 6 [Camellia lanceoleosa]|uniref:Callose synthase 6 n=1 Tax=Camellia lanceoleosa TaxID=1840588 RepID=A0ACC0G8U2_9ERIC|nr:putative callose synthase 6 [Camellia lanceoleosa]